MHELSIAMRIVDIAAEEARRRDKRVLAVHLRLGQLSGVVEQALMSAYELACQDSEVACSRLVIEQVPIVGYCLECDNETPIESIQNLCCQRCGTPTPKIVRGKELEVTALEIES